jgi:tetratricopeptide (TPR) repeat protein
LSRHSKALAAAVLGVCGVAAYATGLFSLFQGDDQFQVVQNAAVSSFNLPMLFQGGTAYDPSQSTTHLIGYYYRPLMETAYAFIYALFGATPFAFHLIQLLLVILCAFLAFRLFSQFLPLTSSIVLSIIFLIHPMTSQDVFAITKMGDVLFLLFGLLALYLLVKSRSARSLWGVVFCLFLCLLAKESGILFVGAAGLYLLSFDRHRLPRFLLILTPLFALYLLLKVSATGLFTVPDNAPIALLSLSDRLLTTPSIIAFYFGRLVFPLPLANAYHWTVTSPTTTGFVLPLLLDLAIAVLIVLAGLAIGRRLERKYSGLYWFFAVWVAAGLAAHSQLIALDMTAVETWFSFSMIGILAMAGIGWLAIWPMLHRRVGRRMVLALGLAVLLALGVRTAWRGLDWENFNTLNQVDLAASPEAFQAEVIVAQTLAQQGHFTDALARANHAVSVFPCVITYTTQGVMLTQLERYPEANAAFQSALSIHRPRTYSVDVVYYDLATLTLFYGDPSANIALLTNAVHQFSNDGHLWVALAVADQRNHDQKGAEIAIQNAFQLGAANQAQVDLVKSGQLLLVPTHPTFG